MKKKHCVLVFQFLLRHVFCESLLDIPRHPRISKKIWISCQVSFWILVFGMPLVLSNFGWILWLKLWLELIGTCHAKALWPGSSAGSHRHQAGTCCEWQEPSRWRQTLSTLLDCRHLWLKDPISVDTPGLPSPRHRRHQPCPGRSLLNGKARKVFSHKFCHQGVPRAPAIQWSLLILVNLNRRLRWIWTKLL